MDRAEAELEAQRAAQKELQLAKIAAVRERTKQEQILDVCRRLKHTVLEQQQQIDALQAKLDVSLTRGRRCDMLIVYYYCTRRAASLHSSSQQLYVTIPIQQRNWTSRCGAR
jgi:hypothetical protein